ncbi:MAG TPA: FAD-dependent thymidylate synthase [Candidatus Pacearchaeota archaeon]|nr:FAD-dependent thymidylate synthase [Candidatus Pacearchaeota archaeon]
MKTEKDLNVTFLGVNPVLTDKQGDMLNPQQVVAISSLATFKGKAIKDLVSDIEKQGQSLNDKTQTILQKSALRGHASLSTTPTISFTYQGTKFIDSAVTGMIFSSSLMSSGRRTDTTHDDIIIPSDIERNKVAKEIYLESSKKLIDVFNEFLRIGIPKDEVSKIYQYGIYGTGIINLPLESIIALKKEYEREIDWMPKEIGLLIQKIEQELKRCGLDLLYATREVAPRNFYPYPNIFKNPKKPNLAVELKRVYKTNGVKSKVFDLHIIPSTGLRKQMLVLGKLSDITMGNLAKTKKNWKQLLELRQDIVRDYNSVMSFKVLSCVPWRVWGDKKRHRTVPQSVQSIYDAVDRSSKIFLKHKNQIDKGNISINLIKDIEKVYSVPPTIRSKKDILQKYLQTVGEAFASYNKLLKLKIKPNDAIFLIPRGVKLDILQTYDLYNFITGYYPLRICSTAEEELRRVAWDEVCQIKELLKQKGYIWLAKFIIPKCKIVGFCPEQKFCPIASTFANKRYNEQYHKAMQEELFSEYQNKLKNLGK